MKILISISLVVAALCLRWLPASWFAGAGAFYVTCVGLLMVVAAFVFLGLGLSDLRKWLEGLAR